MFPIADIDSQQLIAELNSHPAWAELKAWTQQKRAEYLVSVASLIFSNPDLVAEAGLREKAAFFRGMNTVLNHPFFSAETLRREAEKATRETK